MTYSSFAISSFASFALLFGTFANTSAFAQSSTRPPMENPSRIPELRGEELRTPSAGVQGVGGVTNLHRRPRYTFEAIQMYVVNETGVDFVGSDEVVVRFDADNHEIYGGVYGDMDTGETQAFRLAQRCISPAIDPDGLGNGSWACEEMGRPGPVTFTVTLYERDGLLRHWLQGGGFCAGGGNDVQAAGCNAGLESNVVGRYRLSYTEAELQSAMPTPGETSTETILIDNCSEVVTIDNGICGYSAWMPTYAAYRITIRITRKSDDIIEPEVER